MVNLTSSLYLSFRLALALTFLFIQEIICGVQTIIFFRVLYMVFNPMSKLNKSIWSQIWKKEIVHLGKINKITQEAT